MAAKRPEDLLLCHVCRTEEKQVLRSLRSHQDDTPIHSYMKTYLLAFVTAGATRAGAQWMPQQSGTTAEFRGLVAVSPLVVWASGTRGRVARTTDGGKTGASIQSRAPTPWTFATSMR